MADSSTMEVRMELAERLAVTGSLGRMVNLASPE